MHADVRNLPLKYPHTLRKSPPILNLNGKTLKEWSEELHTSTTKVLEMLAWMIRTRKIRDIQFV